MFYIFSCISNTVWNKPKCLAECAKLMSRIIVGCMWSSSGFYCMSRSEPEGWTAGQFVGQSRTIFWPNISALSHHTERRATCSQRFVFITHQMKEMTCRELVKEVAKMWVKARRGCQESSWFEFLAGDGFSTSSPDKWFPVQLFVFFILQNLHRTRRGEG